MKEELNKLIEKYTYSMDDFKELYDKGMDSAYGVLRAYERVIEDLNKLLPTNPQDKGQ